MAICNLCPPEKRDVPDDEMTNHLREVHPEVADDGTRRSDDSAIVPDVTEG
ncbi:hypothetical protein [Actinoplanes sp. NPDC048796]|uniref:hypothetical protein n=1 Tax=unclassified Actinoplanes TaxID=2626549 RepID=UPI0033FCEAA5